MKSPPKKEDDLDMDVAFRLTPEESKQLGAIGPPKMTMDEYVEFLASFEPPSYEALRAKPGPRGGSFRLTF